MTKHDRRTLIKVLHIKACGGDNDARIERDNIMRRRGQAKLGKCIVCGSAVRSRTNTPRCKLHSIRRLYMRKQLSSNQ